MNIFWFLRLFALLTLSVDEGDGGPVEAAVEEPAEEPQTTEDAVLEELGLAEGSQDEPAEPAASVEDGAAEEPVAAEAEPEVPAEPEKSGEITDADLEPLNSRNQRTNERFQKVTEGYKQEKARADELEQRYSRLNDSMSALRELGYADETAAQDLVNFADYRQAIYTGDVEKFQQIIADQIRQFEVAYGKKVSVKASVLDEHPDLREKLDNFDLDEQTAFELARSRSLNDRAMRHSQQQHQMHQQQTQQQQIVAQAASTVDAMQRQWSESDPDFAAILPHLQPHMQEIGQNYPPHMWPQLIDLQYKSIKRALTETRQRETQSNLPLRGNGHMSGRPAPASAQEAVLQELGLAG